MREEAVRYLKSRGMENHWSQVNDDEFAFRRLVQTRSKKASSMGDQELFTQVAYALIDQPDATGKRLYEAIPQAGDYLDQIRTELYDEFPVATANSDPETDELFGGGQYSFDTNTDMALAAEINKPDNRDAARAIIIEVIESQIELKKDVESTLYFLRLLGKAHASLQECVSGALRPECIRDGAEAQLQAIEEKVSQIRRWLSEYA